MKRKNWIKYGIGFFFLGAALIIIVGFATMYLWNWLIPTLFNGNPITFIESIGLLLLVKLLTAFTGWGRGGWGKHNGCYDYRHSGRHHWKQKWEEKMEKMTPEEREKFKSYYYERCGYKFRESKNEDQDTAVNETKEP